MDSWHQHCQVIHLIVFYFILVEYAICHIPKLWCFALFAYIFAYIFQTIMKSCSGIDYGEFASFLKIIAENRIAFLSACSSANTECPRHLSETLAALGSHHAAFDLQRVVHILECLICSEDFKRLDHSTLNLQPEVLVQKIRETIHSTRGQHLP